MKRLLKSVTCREDLLELLESLRAENPHRSFAATTDTIWCHVQPNLWAMMLSRCGEPHADNFALFEPGDPTETLSNAAFAAEVLPLCIDAPNAPKPIPPEIEAVFDVLLQLGQARSDLAQAKAAANEMVAKLAQPTGPTETITLGKMYDAVEGIIDTDQMQDLLRKHGNDLTDVARELKPLFEPHAARLSQAGFQHEWLAYYLPYWTLEAIKRHGPDPRKN